MSSHWNKLKEYKYCLLALYVPLYIGLFFLIERIVPTTGYWVSYCKLDDFIPFNEYFVIAYYLWYPYLLFIGIWLMFNDKINFKLYMYTIIIGFTFSLLFCLIFPNGQDLRPTTFSHDNIFINLIENIYAADTNTNVFPSVHVFGAIVGAVGVITTNTIKSKWIEGTVIFIGVAIIASTCFIKQHSILDALAAMILYVVIYAIVYIFIKNKFLILKKS